MSIATLSSLPINSRRSLRRSRAGVPTGDPVRQLCESLTRAKKITSEEYRILKWLHPQLEDPAASMVWRFIAAWRKWPTCGMPLTRYEVDELLRLLPNPAIEPRAPRPATKTEDAVRVGL